MFWCGMGRSFVAQWHDAGVVLLGRCVCYWWVCQVMHLTVINLWWNMMIVCCEVQVITVNYVLCCWGWGAVGLGGCVGVAVGGGVGDWECLADSCWSFFVLSLVFVGHSFEFVFNLFK